MIVIIDYGMGNIHSVANAFHKIQAEAVVSADPAVIEDADRLVMPGVGAFDEGVRNLRARGLLPVLERRVLGDRIPILGICLGLQLFTRRSDEGHLPGLGWLDADTVRFDRLDGAAMLKIPHMGWNSIAAVSDSPLLTGLDQRRFYFAHAFHVRCDLESAIVARTTYGVHFASVIRSDNLIGTQFHPEKSLSAGLRLLTAFAELR